MTTMQDADRSAPAAVLTELYRAGVDAAAPGPALQQALQRRPGPAGRVWVVALGKAAHPMAACAVEHLTRSGWPLAGGVMIGPDRQEAPPGLTGWVGDHPLPGPGSLAAAGALAGLAARTAPGDTAWVLLSGGATSLAAAPVAGIRPEDLAEIYRMLLGSGLDIVQMNTVRKRFSLWGAGRLAVALQPARVHTFIVSDVIGDDVQAIGSGPCVSDPSSAGEVRRLLRDRGLWSGLPSRARELLEQAESNPDLESPKPDHPAFARSTWELVAGNLLALQAVAKRARKLGWEVLEVPEPVGGDAAAAGERLARLLAAQPGDRAGCLVAGGETVVTLPADSPGTGGRCQQLALAAARVLAGTRPDHPDAVAPTLLAAGTDGRDGPTDAAGAIVDGTTWETIARRGRDPARDLAEHNSHPALGAAGALLRTGLTGTNVMDLMIGVAGRWPQDK